MSLSNLDLLVLLNLIKKESVNVIEIKEDKQLEIYNPENIIKVDINTSMADSKHLIGVIKNSITDKTNIVLINNQYLFIFKDANELKTKIEEVERIYDEYYKKQVDTYNKVYLITKDQKLSKVISVMYAIATKIVDITKEVLKLAFKIASKATGLLKNLIMDVINLIRKESGLEIYNKKLVRYELDTTTDEKQQVILVKLILKDNLTDYDLKDSIVVIQVYDYKTNNVLNINFNYRSSNKPELVKIPYDSEIKRVLIFSQREDLYVDYSYNDKRKTLDIYVYKLEESIEQLKQFSRTSLKFSLAIFLSIFAFVLFFLGNPFEYLFLSGTTETQAAIQSAVQELQPGYHEKPTNTIVAEVSEAAQLGFVAAAIAFMLKSSLLSAVISAIFLIIFDYEEVIRQLKKIYYKFRPEKLKEKIKDGKIEDYDIELYKSDMEHYLSKENIDDKIFRRERKHRRPKNRHDRQHKHNHK